jgi:hypothetical protein
MSRLTLGAICGIVFGLFSVATMIPLKIEDKRRAMLGAFLHRLGVGFVICNATLPWAGWLNGLSLGLLLSLPEALITKAWVPILGFGAAGGIVIGLLAA